MKRPLTTIRRSLGHFRRGFVFLWQASPGLALLNFMLQFVLAVVPVISLYFIKQLVEQLTRGTPAFEALLTPICWFAVTQLLSAVAGQCATYISSIHQQRLTDYVSEKVLEKAIDVDYQYYENPAYHDTLHLAQFQSIYRMPQLLTSVTAIILNAFTLAGIVIFFFTISSAFALWFALLSLPLAIIKWYYGYELYRLERRFAPLEREANYLHRTLTEVSYAKEARTFGFGKSFIAKFKTIRNSIHHQKKAVHLKLTWYSIAAETVEVLAMAVIFGFLARGAWERSVTVGAFVICIQGFQRLQSGSRNFMQALVQLFQLRQFLADLFAFFDIEGSAVHRGHAPYPDGALEVKDLSFTYPQGNREVLADAALRCEPGQIVAIVGENGSGKSTLVKLLANLYDAPAGSVTIGGTDIADIDPEAFRKNTLFHFQDFERYFFSLEENIALGSDELMDRGRLERSASLSGAAQFIDQLANTYGTRMGTIFHGSAQLSGGQWQKVALARMFYKPARLLVLDEPTSALDAYAESALFVNIRQHLKDRMIILVSHRLYNLKIADRIYLVKDGRIAQQGTFDELIAEQGDFKAMFEAQKL